MCVLRARALEAHENRTQAVQWYSLALRLDSYCYEALDRLVSQHMLTATEEKTLLEDGLRFRKCDKWLEEIYSVKMQKVILARPFLFTYFAPAYYLHMPTYLFVDSTTIPKAWRRNSSSWIQSGIWPLMQRWWPSRRSATTIATTPRTRVDVPCGRLAYC